MLWIIFSSSGIVLSQYYTTFASWILKRDRLRKIYKKILFSFMIKIIEKLTLSMTQQII